MKNKTGMLSVKLEASSFKILGFENEHTFYK